MFPEAILQSTNFAFKFYASSFGACPELDSGSHPYETVHSGPQFSHKFHHFSDTLENQRFS